jgi:hypothetical protein
VQVGPKKGLTFSQEPDALVDDVELGLAGGEHPLDEEGLDRRVKDEDGDADEGRVAEILRRPSVVSDATTMVQ